MKKKIILVVCCLILFLIFTSLSFGDIDPKYKWRARPEQELLSPPIDDQSEDILLLIIPNGNGFSLIICTKIDAPKEGPISQEIVRQEAKSEANNGKKGGKLR